MPNSIVKKPERWENPRLHYLKKITKPLPQTCPECGGELNTTIDEDETICETCGLVCNASIEYVAGEHIDLPFRDSFRRCCERKNNLKKNRSVSII